MVRRPFLKKVPIVVIGLLLAACAARDSGGSDQANPPAAGAAPVIATVQIDYSRREDFVRSVGVTKFTGATVIPAPPGEEKGGVSIVRFEGGGVAVWQFHADEGVTRELLTQLPLIDAGRKFAITKLKYGELPRHFIQDSPESVPPEPLEAGAYYVFEVDRALGSTSFEAIRIQADGTIESYDAEPRVGESFALCCNVSPDFSSAPQSSDVPSLQ
jgi:hypothetical protein